MLKAIDDFIIDRLSDAVQFLQDWCFLSQKIIEKALVVLFIIICLLDLGLLTLAHHSLVGESLVDVMILAQIIYECRMTKTERTARRLSWAWMCLRVFFILVFSFVVIITSFGVSKNYYMSIYECLAFAWFGVRGLIAYITVLDVDGVRGKAAKLSIEKLKNLFGDTSWIPQPQEFTFTPKK